MKTPKYLDNAEYQNCLDIISSGLGRLSEYCNKNKGDKLAKMRYKMLHDAFIAPPKWPQKEIDFIEEYNNEVHPHDIDN